MILYVSGRMSGVANFNFPMFNGVAEALRDAGYVVTNPAESFGGVTDLPRSTYLRWDIQQLLMVDGLAMLDGWEESPGACLERHIADELGLVVKPWREWLSC